VLLLRIKGMLSKKNKILFLTVLLISTLCSYSQQIFRGKIVASENNLELENVRILQKESKKEVLSNSFGEFSIEGVGVCIFQRVGYRTKEIELLNQGYLIVQMEINPSELEEVIVSVNQIPQKIRKATSAINLISTSEINRGTDVNIAPVLNRVPGVYMQSGALNTNKITIRGIGSRNLYGTSKIRAYYGDIPLTSGNGETTIEDFELNAISRLEIEKGASSIYGAGLGGTLHLIPKNSYLNQTSAETGITIGSFGLIKGIVNVNHGTEKFGLRAIYSNTHSDGFRANNEYDRQTFTLSSNVFAGEKDDITIIGSYVDLKAFIPSSINEDDYLNNPEKAAFTWSKSQGYEDSQRGILGVSWNHNYIHNLRQITSIYTTFRNGYEPRPFNILDEQSTAFGLRSRLLGETALFENKLDWTLGAEFFKDYYGSKTFENRYQDSPPGTGSVRGELLSDFEETRSYISFFLETKYHLSEKTTFSFGLNLNQTYFDLEDNFEDVGNPDQSGSYDFETMLSPKFGLSHLITNNWSTYINVSHGFSPPTLAETLLPDGLINTDIKPESGWNYELGTRMSFLDNRMHVNGAVYRMAIENLLVARRTGDDQFVGINAGETQHDGVELTINYDWITLDKTSLNSYVSYSLNDFIFEDFVADETDFSGNELTGVPSDVFTAGIDLISEKGFYGNLNFKYIGEIPMTDANSLYTDSYNLTNVKLGYNFTLAKKVDCNLYFGIDNIFDEHYASQILINARGFGGAAPRHYYPGNPINYYTGIHVNYMF
jgi:iron complex outermembrane receptor protein